MSGNGTTDIEKRMAVLQERKAKRDEEKKAKRELQIVHDLEAIEAMADEKHIEIDTRFRVRQMVEGCPVVIGVRAPSDLEWKRYLQKVQGAAELKGIAVAQGKTAAHAELGKVCWVYPAEDETRKALLAVNAGLVTSVGNLAAELAALEAEEEGKG